MIEPSVEPVFLPKLVNGGQAAYHLRLVTIFKLTTKISFGVQSATRLSLLVASIFYLCLATCHTAYAQTQVEAAGTTESTSPVEVPNTLPALRQMIETRYDAAQALQGKAKIIELTKVKMLLGKIAEVFPASNDALNLALGGKVGKVDPAVLDAELATLESQELPLAQIESTIVDPIVAGLTGCMVGSGLSEGGSIVRIQMRVELDELGNIVGMPDLIEPTNPDGGMRKVFQRSLISLDGCPALKLFDLPTAAVITLTSGAVESVTAIPSTIAREALTADVAEPKSNSEPLPFTEPAWVFADSEAEKLLSLGRSEIADLQVRLKLLGFDPKGIDGVAGRAMRKAISDWQTDRALPPSGFVDGRQLEKLRTETAEAFSVWIANTENSGALDRALKPPKSTAKAKGQPAKPSGSRKWYRDGRGWYCTPTILGAMCQRNRP